VDVIPNVYLFLWKGGLMPNAYAHVERRLKQVGEIAVCVCVCEREREGGGS
jgi:hypothetical protein